MMRSTRSSELPSYGDSLNPQSLGDLVFSGVLDRKSGSIVNIDAHILGSVGDQPSQIPRHMFVNCEPGSVGTLLVSVISVVSLAAGSSLESTVSLGSWIVD